MQILMEFTKHKITEAVCAFRFDPSLNPWDVTFLSHYYDLIEPEGFKKKQEIKPFQLSFQVNSNEVSSQPNIQHGEIQMVFKTDDEKHAVLMGNNYISFHTLNHYSGWDIFKPQIISTYIKMYFSLGLGNGLVSAQMIFINNFNLENDKSLSDYLTFVPNMKDFGGGEETSHFFQSNYRIEPNKNLSLKTVLNPGLPFGVKNVVLESNCIAENNQNNSWDNLANEAHDAARNAFIKISSDYFKKLIK